MRARLGIVAALAVCTFVWALSIAAQQSDEIDPTHPAIRYARPSTDPVANLLALPDAISRLTGDGPSCHLLFILQALDVTVSSQIIVF